MFSGCTVPPDSKGTELASNEQEVSPSVGKSTGVVLVPCCTSKCLPATISIDVNDYEVPGCHLLQQVRSQ